MMLNADDSEFPMEIGHMDGIPGPCTNIETGVTTPAGQPLPEIPAQPGSTPLEPIGDPS